LALELDNRFLVAKPGHGPQIVCTGDLSTWGDDGSIEVALGELDSVAKNHGLEHFVIYGNHDVWPGLPPRIPCEASETELDSRRSALRTPGHGVYGTHFGDTFPLHYTTATRFPFHGSPGHLAVCALNTILHDGLLNTLAYGYVGADRYWEGHTTPRQLDALAARQQPPEVRVVLTHHPIHDPETVWLGVLLYRGAVASSLAKPSSSYKRTAYVVLSGHTHCQFPDHGALPTRAPRGRQRHKPLDDDQVQLTTGTLSQRSFDDDKHEHVFQVLRFYEGTDAKHIRIGRITFTRGGTGAFKPLGLASGNTEEFMSIAIS